MSSPSRTTGTLPRVVVGIVVFAFSPALVSPASAQTNRWWTIGPPPIEVPVPPLPGGIPAPWVERAFGSSVSVSGNRLVVGSPNDYRWGHGSGAAYVFVLEGGQWTLEARLSPPNPREYDSFGAAVAISGTRILVGAPGDDLITDAAGAIVGSAPDRGAAHEFQWDGATWQHVWRLEPALDAGDSGMGMRFGASVALPFAAVGSPGYRSSDGEAAGAVWAGGWASPGARTLHMARVTEPVGFGAARRHVGTAVAADSYTFCCYHGWGFTATTLIAGAPGDGSTPGVSQGAAFSSLSWSGQPGRVFSEPAGSPPDAGLGASVALWGTPSLTSAFAVGAPRGTSLAINGGVWPLVPEARPAPYQPVSAAGYGTSIAFLDGETILVAPRNDSEYAPRDPVLAFRKRADGAWSQAYALPGQARGLGGDAFGASMSTSGTLVAIGAPTFPGRSFRPNGVVYVFDHATLDLDEDQLPDAWENQFGLDATSAAGDNGAGGDPDDDGRTNLEEHAAGTHPNNLASATRYFAEGTTNTFPGGRFLTSLLVMNTGDEAAHVLARMLQRDGSVRSETRLVPPQASVSFSPTEIGLEFSTVIESDQPVASERRVAWIGGDTMLGMHAERAVERPATTWYFAEGATHSGMQVFYLLQNPSPVPVTVHASYLRADGTTVEKDHVLPPSSRTTIWANVEEFPQGSGQRLLASAEFGATFAARDEAQIIAERAMYLLRPDGTFGAGHASAGATAPATRWLFAEGATGVFFDEFILIANPGDQLADVSITYALTDGRTFTRNVTVAPRARYNVWVDLESFDGGVTFPLEDVSHSTVVETTNGAGVVSERSMWFPGPTPASWHEAHNTFGSTETGTLWVAPNVTSAQYDYLLLLNPSPAPVRVRLTMTTGYWTEPVERSWELDLLPTSRRTILVKDLGAVVVGVPARIEVVGDSPLPISVELATYQDGRYGVPWATGACRLLTRIR